MARNPAEALRLEVVNQKTELSRVRLDNDSLMKRVQALEAENARRDLALEMIQRRIAELESGGSGLTAMGAGDFEEDQKPDVMGKVKSESQMLAAHNKILVCSRIDSPFRTFAFATD